jgi:hypothetical protein
MDLMKTSVRKHLLKRKEFQDSEYKILDIVEGVGNKSGMAGHMVFKNHKDIEFHSNIEATHRIFERTTKESRRSTLERTRTVGLLFNLYTQMMKFLRFPFM